ncbi:Glutamate--tRNA ligase [bioreactor metagenome]|uniref:Glutamate--tRNA ligase n=1 Tax=bioreactor metagenome TaxID=1076179 RepID=A0A645J774_9ZZZZ
MVAFLRELPEYGAELFTNKKSKTDPAVAREVLELVTPKLCELEPWKRENVHDLLMALCEQTGMKKGTLLYPVRIALSGQSVTPGGAVEILVLLGREESMKRLEAGLVKAENGEND